MNFLIGLKFYFEEIVWKEVVIVFVVFLFFDVVMVIFVQVGKKLSYVILILQMFNNDFFY